MGRFQYWGANRAARRHVDSSDDDDDDADWLRPSASNAHGRGSDDDEFGVSACFLGHPVCKQD